MAGDGDDDELPYVDHGPLNEGPLEKDSENDAWEVNIVVFSV